MSPIRTTSDILHTEAERWSPIYFLSRTETHFPIDANELVRASSLRRRKHSITATSVSPEEFTTLVNADPEGLRRHTLFLPEGRKHPLVAQSKFDPNAPIYVRVARVPGTVDELYISYWLVFAYNGKTDAFGAGRHFADLEHVTAHIKLQNQSSVLLRIYYAQHEGGKWHTIEQQPGQTSARPIVYVAKGSHAAYPTARVYERIGGLAADVADAGFAMNNSNFTVSGVQRPNLVFIDELFDDATNGWMATYKGYLGNGCVASFAARPHLALGETTKNSSCSIL